MSAFTRINPASLVLAFGLAIAATVRGNSSLEAGKNAAPSSGIPYVVVNGKVVVKESKVQKGVYAGKPIRAVPQG